MGIWGALRNVWPAAQEQRCWNHKVLNMLEQVPHRQQAVAKSMLRAIAYAPRGRRRSTSARSSSSGASVTGTGRRRRR
ncbi:MAG: transposase [Armatimonadota bacterium]|nr:transposase [Armatimonadota bacterium]